jgi:hypothetical protein
MVVKVWFLCSLVFQRAFGPRFVFELEVDVRALLVRMQERLLNFLKRCSRVVKRGTSFCQRLRNFLKILPNVCKIV